MRKYRRVIYMSLSTTRVAMHVCSKLRNVGCRNYLFFLLRRYGVVVLTTCVISYARSKDRSTIKYTANACTLARALHHSNCGRVAKQRSEGRMVL